MSTPARYTTARYVVRVPQAWDALAYLLFGDERGAPELVEANPELARAAIVPAGTVIVVPVEDPADALPDVPVAASLPPWKL